MVDYLTSEYITDEGFDLPRLLNDDFFEAIKLLLNNGHYVSATKLLMSFLDTIAFIEYGESSGASFQRWLDTYVDLRPVRITSQELWEHRNSLLHMTNLDSRKVLGGKVRRLLVYVGQLPPGLPTEDQEAKWFDLWNLIQLIAQGIGNYAASMNQNRSKFKSFVQRYDLVVSDKRVLRLNVKQDV